MAAMKLFKLAPRAAFHFGQRGVGVEGTQVFCHADTLFSALCLTMRELDPDGSTALTGLLEKFPRQGHSTGPPPFRLTSAFPYAGDVLFFPKPLVPGKLKQETSQEHGKTLKGVEFVSQGIFTAWLNNEALDGYLKEDENLLHGGDLWVTPGERKALEAFRNEDAGKVQLWKSDPVPHSFILPPVRVPMKKLNYLPNRFSNCSGNELVRVGAWRSIKFRSPDYERSTRWASKSRMVRS